jgi:integrase
VLFRSTAFLGWLADRELRPIDCRQADIDAWHAEHTQHDRITVRGFLLWCTENKLTRRFMLPSAQTGRAAPLTRARRLELLGQVLTTTTTDAPIRSRVAAELLLLYTQPASRIVRLTPDDPIQDDDQVLIRLGDPPSPVPRPFAALLDYAATRSNIRTATNPGSTWLFPGRRANQPLHPDYLAALIHKPEVPTIAGRGAAIRQHVLDMPAPIVADALGHHHVTTTRLTPPPQAGTTWNRYAPGDHSQPPTPRTGDS